MFYIILTLLILINITFIDVFDINTFSAGFSFGVVVVYYLVDKK